MWSLIGHERVVEALARSLREGRLSHAYLFVGPEGVGKMALAVNLAQALNCTDQAPPCDACRACRRTREGKHADVLRLSLAHGRGAPAEARKEIGIEEIKALQQAVGLQPFEGRAKVCIVDGAEHLSGEAANRLLKTLEEPPDNVCFILLARAIANVLPTVASRCRTYELRPVPAARIEEALIARRGAEAAAARTLARLAEGRPGWAIAAAADPSLVEKRAAALDEIAEVASHGYPERLALSERLAEGYSRGDRDEIARWLALLRQWWRDVLLVKAGRPALAVNGDRQEVLDRTAAALSLAEIHAVLARVGATAGYLDRNASPRLALDALLLHLPAIAPGAAVVR